MQTKEERVEAAIIYPKWGQWLKKLEEKVFKKHGWKWGMNIPNYIKAAKQGQEDMFFPMCTDCTKRSEEHK